VGVTGKLGRNVYTLSGNREQRVGAVSTTNLTGSASLTRQLSLDLSATATVSYEHQKTALTGQTAGTFQGNGQLTYALGKNVDAAVSYFYRRTSSSLILVRENSAVLKLTRKF